MMILLNEVRPATAKEESLKEAANLPAIAQVAGVIANPKITAVVRQDTILSTIQAMGLPVKINAVKNVVAEVPDMPTAGAALQKIYQMFGVKGSFMVTWEGKGKLYWDPKTPVEKPIALAYAKQAGLPPPNFTKLLSSASSVKEADEFGNYWFSRPSEMKPFDAKNLVDGMDKLVKADKDSMFDFINQTSKDGGEVIEIIGDPKQWKPFLKKLGIDLHKGRYNGRRK
jgi:hypothetical protein